MDLIDYVISGAIFLFSITIILVMLPQVLPEKTLGFEGLYSQTLNDLTYEVQVKKIVAGNSCANSTSLDCNQWILTWIDANADQNFLSGNPFYFDRNSGKLIAWLRSSDNNFYLLDNNLTSQSFAKYNFDFNAKSIANGFDVQSNFIDANATTNGIKVLFKESSAINSNPDLNIYFNVAENYAIDFNDSKAFKAKGNNDINATFFALAKEIWIDLPSDQNIIFSTDKNFVNAITLNGDKNYHSRDQNWWDWSQADAITWKYRIPLTVHTGNGTTSDANLSIDINFQKKMIENGIQNVPDANKVDTNSIRVVTYSGGVCADRNASKTGCNEVPTNFTYYDNNGMGRVMFGLSEAGGADSVYNYMIYFDLNTNANLKPVEYDITVNPSASLNYFTGIIEKESDVNKMILNLKQLNLTAKKNVSVYFESKTKNKAMTCNATLTNNFNVDCNETAIIRFRYNDGLLNQVAFANSKASELPSKKERMTLLQSFSDFNSSNADQNNQYFINLSAGNLNLKSGIDYNGLNYKSKKFILNYLDSNGNTTNATVSIKVQKR